MSPKVSRNLKLPRRCVVLGPGKWGSALGQCFQDTGIKVVYLGRSARAREWGEAFSSPSLALIATPFEQVPKVLHKLAKTNNLQGVINASKGIHRNKSKTFSQIAKNYLKVPFGTLSGPSFAKELKQRKLTACVIASHSQEWAYAVSQTLSHSYFRVYAHFDPIGVEGCGAIKNILAIACGMSDGLKLGENARAALLTRGLNEMRFLVEKLGGNQATVFGLAGIGDLMLTTMGSSSRNRRLGLALATGLSPTQAKSQIGETIEGLYTLRQVHQLVKKYQLDLPICEQTYRVCFQRKLPKNAIQALMSRNLKAEESSFWQIREKSTSKDRALS